MMVRVLSVEPQGTVAIGRGEDMDGQPVVFGGDWRPMSDIAAALEAGEDVVAEVPDWAVL